VAQLPPLPHHPKRKAPHPPAQPVAVRILPSCRPSVCLCGFACLDPRSQGTVSRQRERVTLGRFPAQRSVSGAWPGRRERPSSSFAWLRRIPCAHSPQLMDTWMHTHAQVSLCTRFHFWVFFGKCSSTLAAPPARFCSFFQIGFCAWTAFYFHLPSTEITVDHHARLVFEIWSC
jgi:hypothetical protein